MMAISIYDQPHKVYFWTMYNRSSYAKAHLFDLPLLEEHDVQELGNQSRAYPALDAVLLAVAAAAALLALRHGDYQPVIVAAVNVKDE